jgi:hypothetical protein
LSLINAYKSLCYNEYFRNGIKINKELSEYIAYKRGLITDKLHKDHIWAINSDDKLLYSVPKEDVKMFNNVIVSINWAYAIKIPIKDIFKVNYEILFDSMIRYRNTFSNDFIQNTLNNYKD